MRIRLSGSVKIFSLEPSLVIERLKARAQALKKEEQKVLGVYLFVSLARGEAVPGSDADMLVVLKDSGKPLLDRAADFMDFFCGAGCKR